MRYLVASLFGVAAVFLLVTVVTAATPLPSAGSTISLSEIFACQDSTHPEWIEFFNAGTSDVSLSNWKIERKSTGDWNTPKVLSATISAGTYYRYDVTNYMNDAGFALRLKDPTDSVIETFPDGGTVEKCPTSESLVSFIKQGMSWSQTTELTPERANVMSALATATPKPEATATPKPTATPTSTPTAIPQPQPKADQPLTGTPGTQPTSVSLSEFSACQNDGEKEWVELANTSVGAVTLQNWKLTDDDNNEQPIPSLTLPGNGVAIVEITKYVRGMLTNDGDVISLFDANGKKVDSYSYESCTKGSSWMKSNGAWTQVSSPSRGRVNPVNETPKPTVSPSPSPTEMLLGDGGDSETPTPTNGTVLGTSDTAKDTAASAQSPTIAYGSIGFGVLLLTGVGVYYGYTYWKAHRS